MNSKMKAVVFHSPHNIQLETVDTPQIKKSTDVFLVLGQHLVV